MEKVNATDIFLIKLCNSIIKKEQLLKNVLYSIPDPDVYEGGKPKIKVYERAGRKPIILVSGIRKTFDYIRKKFGTNAIKTDGKESMVFVISPVILTFL